MASVFDEIFSLSGDAPVNPLFSSNNKFKSAKAAEILASVQPAVKGDVCVQRTADIPAPVKDKKTGRKRKAAEPAAPQQATESSHKHTKVVAPSHTKHKLSASKNQAKQDAPDHAQLGKRKRQGVRSSDMVQPSHAVQSNTDDVNEVSDDASAAVYEAATQVHTASQAPVLSTFDAASCELTGLLL